MQVRRISGEACGSGRSASKRLARAQLQGRLRRPWRVTAPAHARRRPAWGSVISPGASRASSSRANKGLALRGRQAVQAGSGQMQQAFGAAVAGDQGLCSGLEGPRPPGRLQRLAACPGSQDGHLTTTPPKECGAAPTARWSCCQRCRWARAATGCPAATGAQPTHQQAAMQVVASAQQRPCAGAGCHGLVPCWASSISSRHCTWAWGCDQSRGQSAGGAHWPGARGAIEFGHQLLSASVSRPCSLRTKSIARCSVSCSDRA